MTERNIHGEWTMSFETRILKSEVIGTTNAEAGKLWFKELDRYLLASEEKYDAPWVILLDCRQWNMTALDTWEVNNEITTWLSNNGCIFEAMIFSKKIQYFDAQQGLDNHKIIHYFFDYDEAYQAGLDALADAKN